MILAMRRELLQHDSSRLCELHKSVLEIVGVGIVFPSPPVALAGLEPVLDALGRVPLVVAGTICELGDGGGAAAGGQAGGVVWGGPAGGWTWTLWGGGGMGRGVHKGMEGNREAGAQILNNG